MGQVPARRVLRSGWLSSLRMFHGIESSAHRRIARSLSPMKKQSFICRRRSFRGKSCPQTAIGSTLTSSRFDCLATQAALESIPGYFRCHAEGCDYGHVHEDEGDQNNIWRCQNPECDARTCTTHYIPFHTDETCEQYDARKGGVDKQEAASLAIVRQISTPYPNVECGYNIHKISGCDHMTCKYHKYPSCRPS
jgi:hypothetical protein